METQTSSTSLFETGKPTSSHVDPPSGRDSGVTGTVNTKSLSYLEPSQSKQSSLYVTQNRQVVIDSRFDHLYNKRGNAHKHFRRVVPQNYNPNEVLHMHFDRSSLSTPLTQDQLRAYKTNKIELKTFTFHQSTHMGFNMSKNWVSHESNRKKIGYGIPIHSKMKLQLKAAMGVKDYKHSFQEKYNQTNWFRQTSIVDFIHHFILNAKVCYGKRQISAFLLSHIPEFKLYNKQLGFDINNLTKFIKFYIRMNVKEIPIKQAWPIHPTGEMKGKFIDKLVVKDCPSNFTEDEDDSDNENFYNDQDKTNFISFIPEHQVPKVNSVQEFAMFKNNKKKLVPKTIISTKRKSEQTLSTHDVKKRIFNQRNKHLKNRWVPPNASEEFSSIASSMTSNSPKATNIISPVSSITHTLSIEETSTSSKVIIAKHNPKQSITSSSNTNKAQTHKVDKRHPNSQILRAQQEYKDLKYKTELVRPVLCLPKLFNTNTPRYQHDFENHFEYVKYITNSFHSFSENVCITALDANKDPFRDDIDYDKLINKVLVDCLFDLKIRYSYNIEPYRATQQDYIHARNSVSTCMDGLIHFLNNLPTNTIWDKPMEKDILSRHYERPPLNKDSRVCMCPCSIHFARWRQLTKISNDIFFQDNYICDTKSKTPQELISHLSSMKDKCHIHFALYKYLFYKHEGFSDPVQVSNIFSANEHLFKLKR